jgi:hypothetical protein
VFSALCVTQISRSICNSVSTAAATAEAGRLKFGSKEAQGVVVIDGGKKKKKKRKKDGTLVRYEEKPGRFVKKGFDLSLTYVAPNVIAMGPPVSDAKFHKCKAPEQANMLSAIAAFAKKMHGGNFRVYDMSAKASYDYTTLEAIGGTVTNEFGFADGNAPPFNAIVKFVRDAHAFLSADARNVIMVHCNTGLDNTCVMTSGR